MPLSKETLVALAKPFPPEYIEWVLQRKSKDGTKATFAANVDPRHYYARLNDVVGGDWTSNITQITEDWSKVRCDLTIEGVTRSDFSEQPTDSLNILTQSVAQAFKRACTWFGLGSDLYHIPMMYVEIDEYGKPKTTPPLGSAYLDKCGKSAPAVGKLNGAALAEEALALGKAFQDGMAAERKATTSEITWDNISTPAPVAGEPTVADYIKDDENRAGWWAEAKTLGLDHDAVHCALGVKSLSECKLPLSAAMAKLKGEKTGTCPVHGVPCTRKEKDGKIWYSHKDGDVWCNGKSPKKEA